MVQTVKDAAGATIALGQLLGKGGEGSVYELGSDKALVAKIYHKEMAPERVQKLRAMTTLDAADLGKFTAWPRHLLFVSGKPRGFIMPRMVGHKDIHALYSPKSRRMEFPDADFRFLLRTAANVARAFAAVHKAGCVIGDVNHGSVQVSSRATVTLIDCDSFQLSSNGQTFYCDVGTPTFTPPELQGKPFRGVTRIPNHDHFGLAVMLFQLLMMGRHPFSGRFTGSGEMPIEKAIGEFRFAFGIHRKSFQMEPPPHSLPLSVLSSSIADLFERAFARDASFKPVRPSPVDWANALSQLELSLQACATTPGHHYLKGLHHCPWCRVEKTLGVSLFGIYIAQQTGTGQFNLTAIWAAIEHIGPPPAEPQLPRIDNDEFTLPPDVDDHNIMKMIRRIGSLLLLAAAAVLFFGEFGVPGIFGIGALIGAWAAWPGDNSALKSKLQAAERAAANVHKSAEDRWDREAGTTRFSEKKANLAKSRQALLNLPSLKQVRLKELMDNRRADQLKKHLERFLIEHATIKGIGPGKKATLESYNIETAWDLTESAILNVPGFGPATARNLITWRRSLEARFKFNPALGIDPADAARLEKEIVALKRKYELELLNGPRELEGIKKQIELTRQHLMPERIRAYREHRQAKYVLEQL